MQDTIDLRNVERIPSLEQRNIFSWPHFLLESVLAIGGALVVTGLISLFHLYPQIPNISLIYLLLILLLASTFGRYAAVLASVTSFLAFDYFLVPPLYTFTIARSRGMDCSVRLPCDCTPDKPAHSASTAPGTRDELALVHTTMTQGHIQEKRSAPPPDIRDTEHHVHYYASIGPVTILRLIPLQTDQHVFAVLCLRIQHPVSWFAGVEHMEKDRSRPGSRVGFFWTYLEQVTSLIERAVLRSAAA